MYPATWTSVRTCTPTLSCPAAPPCTPVSLTVCRRRSPPWPPPPSRSRSSLPPRGSTPSGSAAPSWPPSPPSSRCGSPSRSTTSAAPPLSTASASKRFDVNCCCHPPCIGISTNSCQWIDPNAGSAHDAVLVHCNATTYETCIWPKVPNVDSQEYNGNNKYVWVNRDVNEEAEIAYAASHVQIKMLRVKSERVRQNITYNCFNSNAKLRVLTDKDETSNIKDVADVVSDECKHKDSTWRRSVFEIDTDDLEMLPVQDIAIKASANEKFGFNVGPVCFS